MSIEIDFNSRQVVSIQVNICLFKYFQFYSIEADLSQMKFKELRIEWMQVESIQALAFNSFYFDEQAKL